MKKTRTVARCRCGATTGTRRWGREGWLRQVTTFFDGSKSTLYICPACRERNIAAYNASKQNQEAA